MGNKNNREKKKIQFGYVAPCLPSSLFHQKLYTRSENINDKGEINP